MLEEHTVPVLSVSFSPDGKTIASGGTYDGPFLWDIATLRKISSLDTGYILSISFSPDGKTIASGGTTWSSDGNVRLWDVATQTKIGSLGTPTTNSVIFSPDGKTIAIGADRGEIVSLWDVATQTEIGRHWEHTGAVKSVVFSPDGGTPRECGGVLTALYVCGMWIHGQKLLYFEDIPVGSIV